MKPGNGTTNGATKPQANGKHVEPDLSNSILDKETGELKIATAETQTPAVEQKPVLDIAARLLKLDALNELVERRDNIQSALEGLKKFYIAPTGSNCQLKLTDSKNTTFTIAHPSVIGEIVNFCTGKFRDELAMIENSIVFS